MCETVFMIRWRLPSHVAIKLLFAILNAISLTLESAKTLKTLAWLAYEYSAFAEHTDQAGPLNLLLKTLLQAVIGFFAVFVGMDSHKVRGVYGRGKADARIF